MKDNSANPYRERLPHWLEDETIQNFGDYLSEYFASRLFLRIPRLPGEVRIVGSYLDDGLIWPTINELKTDKFPQRACLTAWGGGVRQPGGISSEVLAQIDILSVRGRLSANELELGDSVPIGDPGLLLPALYSPKTDSRFHGKGICVPHFNDHRADLEIAEITGADAILRPTVKSNHQEIENFIDALTTADFVLCGSLHAAIVAAAYGTPFAFWNSGCIDLPFKWQDFADSIGIPCRFVDDLAEGRSFYQTDITPKLNFPSMWPMLAAAPYPIRPEALLSLIAWDAQRLGISETSLLREIRDNFGRKRWAQDDIAADSNLQVDTLWEMHRTNAETQKALSEEIAALQHERAETSAALEQLKVSSAEEQQALLERIAALQVEIAEQAKSASAIASAEASSRIDELEQQLSASRTDLSRAETVKAEYERRIAGLMGKLAATMSELTQLRQLGEQAYFQLYKAYRRPMRPFKLYFERALLRLALLFRFAMPKKMSRRFKKSLNKRKPKTLLLDWQKRSSDLRLRNVTSEANDESSLLLGRPPAMTAEDRVRQNSILVIDYRLPQPDVSAGEKATLGMLRDLAALGYRVTFLATDMERRSPYFEDVQALGVEVVTRMKDVEWADQFIRKNGHKFGVFYIMRVDVAEQTLTAAREASPSARIIFHAPDLYFFREGRAAALSGDPAQIKQAEETKLRELSMMNAADHVVLVSPAEVPKLVDNGLSEDKISVFPALYSAVVAQPAGFSERKHIFFLGGFGHTPNIDSVLWFAQNVWPQIYAANPEIEFHVIGAEAPDAIRALDEQPGIRFIGFVRDIDAAMSAYRLSVAPLIYGAGIKGKVGAAMGAGIPTICTTIAAEGMHIVDGIHTLVADRPEDFANAVLKLYPDEDLWNRFSQNGRRLIDENFGNEANRASYLRALDRARALPIDRIVSYCQDETRTIAFPEYDADQPIDVSVIIPVYNKWSLTRACLASVALAGRAGGISYEVIIANDGSTDETEREAALIPGLKIATTPENLGFLRNCNNAASTARGKNLLFLNNDTIVMPNWLNALVETMDSEAKAGIVGSKLVYPDGKIQEAGGLLFSNAQGGNFGRGREREDPDCVTQRDVDYISGASILVNGAFWAKVGGFDERYQPAYCEDSDLAMAARANGFRVIYVPGSEVVHFEHSSYGDELSSRPKQLMTDNNKKLFQKWQEQFESEHIPHQCGDVLAAANADRLPSRKARERRRSGRLNVLYFSPFPPRQGEDGSQAASEAFCKNIQALGHKVHFGLLQTPFCERSVLTEMCSTWDSLDILPNSYLLSANGEDIPFDGWYEDGLGENIRILCARYDIDVVICSYIFQSKLLEFVPEHVLKIIDTHDKTGDRYDMLRKNKQKLEFFCRSPEEEGRYLRRADYVVARRREDAEYFNAVSGLDNAVVIPHFEEPRFSARTFSSLKHVGLVASANRIDLDLMLEFLKSLEKSLQGRPCPFKVHIAGQVKDMVGELPQKDAAYFAAGHVTMHGFVRNIADFYALVDVVVSPVTMGTGINGKTVQAMAFGMPLLTTAAGSQGIETGEPFHHHETLDELCASLLVLSGDPSALERLARVSRERYSAFHQDGVNAINDLMARVETYDDVDRVAAAPERDFYSLSEAERIAATKSVIATKTSLVERWKMLGTANLDKEGTQPWSERSAKAADYLSEAKSVTDFGCGTMPLKQFLKSDQRYTPVDIVSRDAQTIVCDFNVDEPPVTGTEAAVCLGLLEYLHDPLAFLKFVSEHHRLVVLSYCTTDSPIPLEPRLAHAWVNALSQAEIEALFAEAGLQIVTSEQIDNGQRLWQLLGKAL
ncbi:glycosyltransferase [Martelella sp. HB161492]|uniref:glycosyltransferase n=1 Tax=Martelella sp. HB161492 TaxID=2720726 RepID=UPI0015901C1F